MNLRRKNNSSIIWLVTAFIVLIGIIFYLRKDNSITADEEAVAVADSQTPIQSPTPMPQIDLALIQLPAQKTISAKILMYHHVGSLPENADDIRKGLTVSRENFESQINYLVNNKFNIVTLSELYESISKGEDVSRDVVLTFDDGYSDNYSDAFAIMKRYHVTGTFFIITSKIGQSEYMNSDQIKELVVGGNEIGSHTLSHPDLSKSSGTKLKQEVTQSKEELEKITDWPVYSFCYPAGKFSAEVERVLEEVGYKIAVTTQAGKVFSTDKIFEVPRYRMNPTTRLQALFK